VNDRLKKVGAAGILITMASGLGTTLGTSAYNQIDSNKVEIIKMRSEIDSLKDLNQAYNETMKEMAQDIKLILREMPRKNN